MSIIYCCLSLAACSVCVVGSSTSAGKGVKQGTTEVDILSKFSSRGPSMDARIKPEIVASGEYILSVGARLDPSCDPPSLNELPDPGKASSQYGVVSKKGTSMAAPVVSGHAALVRQYFAEGWHGDGTNGSAAPLLPTAALLKAVLINGAQPLDGYGLNEVDSKQGFGRLSLIDSIPLAGVNELQGVFWDEVSILRGDTNTYSGVVEHNITECNDTAASATIVWADPPGCKSSNRVSTKLCQFVLEPYPVIPVFVPQILGVRSAS